MADHLDIFRGDAFSLVSSTEAVNKQVYIPGRLGALGIFKIESIDTLDVSVEEKEGVLYLVPNKQRGADATQNQKEGRKRRILSTNHLPVGDRLYAHEIQGVRAFGQQSVLETIQGKVNDKMATMAQSIQATLEYHRVGAIKGQILDADGSTVLHDLFDEFDITPYSTVNFDLAVDNEADGSLREKCADIVRNIGNALGATPFMGVHAECGDAFFNALLKEPEVRATYLQTPMAAVLRDGFVYPNGLKVWGAFEFGGIVWENYRGSVGNVSFIDTDSVHLFPMGAPGLFRTAFAPMDHVNFTNTPGLPLYAQTTVDPKGRWVDIDVESNPLVYCTRPKALITGVRAT
jgi:hypothetical protein